jgi:hypothetical protein
LVAALRQWPGQTLRRFGLKENVMDSFAGGLARGLQNARGMQQQQYQMQLQQENQERLDKMAKLQGQLVQMQLEQNTREQAAKQQVREMLAGMQPTAPATSDELWAGTDQFSDNSQQFQAGGFDPRSGPPIRAGDSVLDMITGDKGLMGALIESGMMDLGDIARLSQQQQGQAMMREFAGGPGGPVNLQPTGQGRGWTSPPSMPSPKRTLKVGPDGLLSMDAAPGSVTVRDEGGERVVLDSQMGGELSRQAIPQQITQPDGSVTLGGVMLEPASRDRAVTGEDVAKWMDINGDPIPLAQRGTLSPKQMREGVVGKDGKRRKFAVADDDTQSAFIALKNARFQADELAKTYEAALTVSEERMEEIFGSSGIFSGISEKLKGNAAIQSMQNRIDLITGANEPLRLYLDRAMSMAVQIARAGGEVGTMTEGDIARALAKLPDLGIRYNDDGSLRFFGGRIADSPEQAAEKIRRLIATAEQTGVLGRHRAQFLPPEVSIQEWDAMTPEERALFE